MLRPYQNGSKLKLERNAIGSKVTEPVKCERLSQLDINFKKCNCQDFTTPINPGPDIPQGIKERKNSLGHHHPQPPQTIAEKRP